MSKVRTDLNFLILIFQFFHLASTAAIWVSFAIVLSCCVTVSAGELSPVNRSCLKEQWTVLPPMSATDSL